VGRREGARAPRPELAAIEHALHLAILLEAYALEAIVVIDEDEGVVATAGRAEHARELARAAAELTPRDLGDLLGDDTDPPPCVASAENGGRVHAERVRIGGARCVVALRGRARLSSETVIVEAVRLAMAPADDPALEVAPATQADAEDDFELDLCGIDEGERPSVGHATV
jgi:hypothetical protein